MVSYFLRQNANRDSQDQFTYENRFARYSHTTFLICLLVPKKQISSLPETKMLLESELTCKGLSQRRRLKTINKINCDI
jgi:hypothetical protein